MDRKTQTYADSSNTTSVKITSNPGVKLPFIARIVLVLALTFFGLFLVPIGAYVSTFVNGSAALPVYEAPLIGACGSFVLGILIIGAILPILPPTPTILSYVASILKNFSPLLFTPIPTRRKLFTPIDTRQNPLTSPSRDSWQYRWVNARIQVSIDNLHRHGHMSAALFLAVIPVFMFYAAAGAMGYAVLLTWRIRHVEPGMRVDFFVESFAARGVYWAQSGYIGYGVMVLIAVGLWLVRLWYLDFQHRKSVKGKGKILASVKRM